MNTFSAVILTLLVFWATACAYLKRDVIRGLFGPPAVTLTEHHTQKPDGARFDHTPFDRLLAKYVSLEGQVDYQKLATEAHALDAYIASVAQCPFDQLGRDEKLALLINAYNAFTLRLILDHNPIRSIKDIPAQKRWDHVRWRIGANMWSLNQIEHKQIRPHFKEPRVHFALVCAAVGCPPLRNEAYRADQLDAQLEDQTQAVHQRSRWFQYDKHANRVKLTPLYRWYSGDFEQIAGSVLNFAARYHRPLAQAIENGQQPEIQWLDYDWSLNSQNHRR